MNNIPGFMGGGEPVSIEIKNLNKRLPARVYITRTPRQMSGWYKVRYNNKWYQLHGGVHVNLFINLANPLN